MSDAFTDDDLANAEDRMRQAEAARTADRPSLRGIAEKLLAAIDAKDEANIHGWSAALRQALEDQEAALRAGGSLDEAWAEVESALPEGWGLSLEHLPKGGWTAIAGPEDWRWPIESKAVRGEPTATAALRALAARLSEPPQ